MGGRVIGIGCVGGHGLKVGVGVRVGGWAW